MREVTVTEPGYAFIFLSNENPTQVDVHFDDVTITHTHSSIVAGADYYPFGLAMENREITNEPYRYGYQGQFSEKDLTTVSSFGGGGGCTSEGTTPRWDHESSLESNTCPADPSFLGGLGGGKIVT